VYKGVLTFAASELLGFDGDTVLDQVAQIMEVGRGHVKLVGVVAGSVVLNFEVRTRTVAGSANTIDVDAAVEKLRVRISEDTTLNNAVVTDFSATMGPSGKLIRSHMLCHISTLPLPSSLAH
jgi:hypothetical protein